MNEEEKMKKERIRQRVNLILVELGKIIEDLNEMDGIKIVGESGSTPI